MNEAGTGLAKVALIALMAVGSIFLWIGIPVGWLWIGSQLQSDSGQASFGLYLGVLVGIIVSMVVTGKLLHGLNGVYGRLTGAETVRVRMPWHRSLRGEDEGRAPQPDPRRRDGRLGDVGRIRLPDLVPLLRRIVVAWRRRPKLGSS